MHQTVRHPSKRIWHLFVGTPLAPMRFPWRVGFQGELTMTGTVAGRRMAGSGLNKLRTALVVGAAAVTMASPAAAHVQTFSTNFTALNAGAPLNKVGLNPTASAQFFYNHDDETFRVKVFGTGFEAGIPHVAHIHGNLVNPMTSGSGALDAKTPTLAQDADGDGFIELFEGQKTYGPILFDFENIDTDQDGTINYDMTFNLNDPNAPFGFINPLDPSQGRYGITDLVGLTYNQLDLREMVIHGLTVPAGVGIDNPNQEPPVDDEINGRNIFAPPAGQPPFGYTVVFPVASGELVAGIPEPANWALMISGFGLVGGMVRARKRRAALA